MAEPVQSGGRGTGPGPVFLNPSRVVNMGSYIYTDMMVPETDRGRYPYQGIRPGRIRYGASLSHKLCGLRLVDRSGEALEGNDHQARTHNNLPYGRTADKNLTAHIMQAQSASRVRKRAERAVANDVIDFATIGSSSS